MTTVTSSSFTLSSSGGVGRGEGGGTEVLDMASACLWSCGERLPHFMHM